MGGSALIGYTVQAASKSRSEKIKILPLTSIRFFAAFSVVLYHAQGVLAALGVSNVLMRIVGLGYVSVGFFFMLSGFILALVYLKDGKPIDRRKFYWARVARIYPLYLMAMLLDFPHFIHIGRLVEHRSLLNMAWIFGSTTGLIQAWTGQTEKINSPGWSLSVEAFFYLIFPFIALPLWKIPGKVMWPFALALYGGGMWLVVAVSNSGKSLEFKTYNPITHFYIFVLGISVARLFVWLQADEGRSGRLQRVAPWVMVGVAAGFLAIPILNAPVEEPLLQHGLLVPLYAGTLLALAGGNGLIPSVLSAKWLLVLGEASFALYLIHMPLYTIMRRLIEGHGGAGLLLYLVTCIGLSVASIYWLEIPARRWILDRLHVT
jgi:peptidoglycan/LPS O-acetylase OafA/YrhL